MFFSHSETKSLIFFFHDPLCLRFRQKIQNSSFYAFQQNSAAFRKPFPICLAGQQDPEAVLEYKTEETEETLASERFKAKLYINGKLISEGRGQSKKQAEQNAAVTACKKLNVK